MKFGLPMFAKDWVDQHYEQGDDSQASRPRCAEPCSDLKYLALKLILLTPNAFRHPAKRSSCRRLWLGNLIASIPRWAKISVMCW